MPATTPVVATPAAPLSILMVASEAHPYAKTGGLAEVTAALTDSLARLGHRVTLVLPRYPGIETADAERVNATLRFGDRLDGHLVSGHVDGTGAVVRFEPVGESWTLVVRAPRALARFIALKGSIAIDGVSLTINSVDDYADGCDFSINLIPHTVAVTTLKTLKVGDRVNLEIDTIARYVERMLGTESDIRAAA